MLVKKCILYQKLLIVTLYSKGTMEANLSIMNYLIFAKNIKLHLLDHVHVEEKNGSIVRRMIGYDRYEGNKAWHVLADLYAVVRLHVNYFQPSLKLKSKTRNGSKTTKKYDEAQTPCQRLLNSENVPQEVKDTLKNEYNSLDPVDLPNRKYRSTRKPRKTKRLKTWRTRPDPFEKVWGDLQLQLEINPHKTAKGLLDNLIAKQDGNFSLKHLRTLQRRVAKWRTEQSNKAKQHHIALCVQGKQTNQFLSLVNGRRKRVIFFVSQQSSNS